MNKNTKRQNSKSEKLKVLLFRLIGKSTLLNPIKRKGMEIITKLRVLYNFYLKELYKRIVTILFFVLLYQSKKTIYVFYYHGNPPKDYSIIYPSNNWQRSQLNNIKCLLTWQKTMAVQIPVKAKINWAKYQN